MRWPWRRKVSGDRLVIAWSEGRFAYVQAQQGAGGAFDIRKLGVENQPQGDLESLTARLSDLNLHGGTVQGLLRPEQYQLLQIESPKVPPEEMRQAARYLIREMVDVHVDDLTIDVLSVGDGETKSVNLMYVVAARNAVIQEVTGVAQAMEWPMDVIDVQELAHRNLQTALSERAGNPDRATAALIVTSERQAIITISAKGELFFSRRLDLPDGFMDMDWGTKADMLDGAASDTYTPVGEYVPEYAGNPLSISTETTDTDRAQRVVAEVQRSLDLWDRTWSSLPLALVQVHAGAKSEQLANWLTQELGQLVEVMDIAALFPQFAAADADTQLSCMPLLGLLLRTENGKV